MTCIHELGLGMQIVKDSQNTVWLFLQSVNEKPDPLSFQVVILCPNDK